MVVLFGVLCVVVTLIGLGLFALTRSMCRFPCGSVCIVVGVLSLVGIVVPALGTLNGTRDSRLVERRVMTDDEVADRVEDAVGAFSLPLVAVAVGDGLAAATVLRRRRARNPAGERPWSSSRATRVIVWSLGLAFVAEVLQGRRALIDVAGVSTRAQATGQGTLQMLSWLPAIAIIVALEQRHHWSRRRIVLIAGPSAVVLLGGGDRSPFMFLGAYGLAHLISTTARTGLKARRLVGLVAAAYAAAVLIGTVPAWRQEVKGFSDRSLSSIVRDTASNPIGGLADRGAVDTLDGMILVRSLPPEVTAKYSWMRLGDAVTLFVPSQLWTDKPLPVSSDISQSVLHFKESGMFLSGAGYLSIVLKSPPLEVASWLVFGFGMSLALARRSRGPSESLAAALLLFFGVYFWFAGDAFNVFFVTGLGIVAFVVAQLGRLRLAHGSTGQASRSMTLAATFRQVSDSGSETGVASSASAAASSDRQSEAR